MYGESWEDWRFKYWKKYNLKFILDTGKAFDNVLLEQTAFGLTKKEQNNFVKLNFFNNKDRQIHNFSNSEKDAIFKDNNTVQIYLKYYPESIIEKIEKKSCKEKVVSGDLGLGIGTDFFSNEKTDYKLLKGIDIDKWRIKQHRFLKNKKKLNWNNAKRFLKSKVICQRLVAHIENPIPHIKITACYDSIGIIITNTLTAFTLCEGIKEKFWLAYINSKLISWFAYNFIYARAIRGMDLYSFYIEQIPVPKITIDQQQPFIIIVNQILNITKSKNYLENTEKQARVKELEKEIDKLVYELYSFNKEEIEIVESKQYKREALK